MPLEEIFVGYACSSDHTPILTLRSLVKIFVVFIFAVTCRSAKNAKICTPRKFPAIRYLELVKSIFVPIKQRSAGYVL